MLCKENYCLTLYRPHNHLNLQTIVHSQIDGCCKLDIAFDYITYEFMKLSFGIYLHKKIPFSKQPIPKLVFYPTPNSQQILESSPSKC